MKSKSNRHPRVEALLQRALLSVSVVKETLTVEGTTGRDEISLSVHPQVINLMSVKVNGDEKVFLLGSFKVINISTLGGNDMVRVGELYDAHPAYLNIDLGPGNDRVYGSAHAEKISGGTGNDRISAGAGNDYVNAGAGDDVIVGDAGNDTLIGLDGNDTIYGNDGIDSIASGEGDDSINGGNQTDWIFAAGGNDRIVEKETRLIGSNGSTEDSGNFIDAGDGNDYVEAVWNVPYSGNSDTIRGGRGDDYLFDHADYSHPSQTYYTTTTSNKVLLSGGDGDDKLIGYNCSGDAGNDRLIHADKSGDIVFNGGTGDDVLISKFEMNQGSIAGGAGNDIIENESYGVRIEGGAGNDSITSNYAASGGDGDDLLRTWQGLIANTIFYVPLNNDGGAGNDTIWGSPLADTLTGGDGNDVLYGLAYGDSISGDAGNDTIYGGSGDDSLHGGEGSDSLFGGDSKDTDRSDDGRDYGYGEGGKDWFDPKHKWELTDSSPLDDNVITTSSSSSVYRPPNYGGSSYSDMLSLAQHYGSTLVDPDAPSTAAPKPALLFLGNAAVLSGTHYTTTALTSQEIQIPELTVKERKAVVGNFVHLPADWTLTRMGKRGGIVWYRIQQGEKPYGLAKGALLNPLGLSNSISSESASNGQNSVNFDDLWNLANQYGQGTSIAPSRKTLSKNASMSAYAIGLHPSTTILTDASTSVRDVTAWPAAQALTSASVVTKPRSTAILASSGATISFAQPSPDVLTTLSLERGGRYLYTSAGLRMIGPTGVGDPIS